MSQLELDRSLRSLLRLLNDLGVTTRMSKGVMVIV
eukprot:gene18832-6213_t